MTPLQLSLLDKAIQKADGVRISLRNQHNPYGQHLSEVVNLLRSIKDDATGKPIPGRKG